MVCVTKAMSVITAQIQPTVRILQLSLQNGIQIQRTPAIMPTMVPAMKAMDVIMEPTPTIAITQRQRGQLRMITEMIPANTPSTTNVMKGLTAFLEPTPAIVAVIENAGKVHLHGTSRYVDFEVSVDRLTSLIHERFSHEICA